MPESPSDGPRLTLRLDSLAFGGDAVGRGADGRVVFVPRGAPGDLVVVRVVEQRRAYARAEIEEVLEPGARVEPPCPIAGECGGCPWQHVEPAAQLLAKETIVRRALEKVGVEGCAPIVAAPAWLGYRSRARMSARAGAFGFSARRTHRVIDVERCPALEGALDRALSAARAALRDAIGENGSVAGLVSEDGQVQLSIEGGYGALAETLADQAADLLGSHGIAGVLLHAGDVSRIYGPPSLEMAGGFHASADGFAQANHAQNQRLRQWVREWAVPEPWPPDVGLLELYAGDGNFTRDLVRRARVTAVEADARAATRLRENLRSVAPRRPPDEATPAGFHPWSVRNEASAVAVRRLAAAGDRFDVVVLDPPRAGAAELLEPLFQLGAHRLVYISCDPMTLARDVGRLAQLGYRVSRAQPVDMMPHTAHVEVVCVLERSPKPTEGSIASG